MVLSTLVVLSELNLYRMSTASQLATEMHLLAQAARTHAHASLRRVAAAPRVRGVGDPASWFLVVVRGGRCVACRSSLCLGSLGRCAFSASLLDTAVVTVGR
jgi:hypothetical protein